MSLLSRSTGGRRRSASVAAVFVGTLLTYLTITAIPAVAVTTCSFVGTVGTVNVGTDDKVVIRINAGNYEISVNGGAFAVCGLAAVAATDDLLIVGSDAGAETFTFFHPADFSTGAALNNRHIVDLGNGNDSLVLEYGGLASPLLPDPGSNDVLLLGSATGGVKVGDMNAGGVGDLRIDDAEVLTVNGGDGNDSLDAGNLAGMGANDGPGTANDIPEANNPFNASLNLNGGNGDDDLVSGDGNDNFQGGPGDDGVNYEAASGAVTVNLQAATGTGMGADTLADVQNATGGDFDDILIGNTLDNELFGGDGDDTLTGAGGNDLVEGQADDDVVNEEAAANGADELHGGPGGGCDTLNYGARTTATVINETTGVSGADANADGDAADTGDEGDDTGGFEMLVTGSGNDNLVGDSSPENFQPGAGNDTVDGNAQNGTDGCDLDFDFLDLSVVAGPANFNLITGTATGNGTDTFTDLEGYVGTAGNDSVIVGDTAANGNTLGDFAGGAGQDTVDATANTLGITIDLSVFGNGQEVEDALGGSGNDILTGNVLNNRLIGNAGNDLISAGTGNDFVEGGLGNDSLTDGGGADRLSYRNAPSGEIIDGANGFASGGDGEDTLVGGWEFILGSNFNDDITGGQNSVNVPTRIKGFKGNDVITGTNSTDTLAGGAGNDQIRAGSGDDGLRGGAGNDLLLAGSGDDRLNGGRGRDRGVGGPGFDVCRAETEQSCEA